MGTIRHVPSLALAFLLLIPLNGEAFAAGADCWREVHDGWTVSPGISTEVYSLLRNTALRESGPVEALTMLRKPRGDSPWSIYLKTNTRAMFSFNGTPLRVQPLSEFEYRYDIPDGLWKESNDLELTVAPGEVPANVTPALYLTCRRGIRRLRNATIRIDQDLIDDKGSVDLSGPVFMNVLDDGEYLALQRDPGSYRIDAGEAITALAPAPAGHFLKKSGDSHLLTEFSIELSRMPDRPLCLFINTITGPDRIYLDGTLIGSTGTPGDTRKLYYDRSRIYPIPDRLLQPGNAHRIMVLSSRSTDYLFGNIEGTDLKIGNMDALIGEQNIRETVAIAIACIYLIVGLYYGLLFLQRRENREYLFYALAAVSLSLYFFLRTQTKYLLSDDFLTLKRIEYVTLFLMMPFLALFMHYFFPPRHTVTEKLFRGALYLYLPCAVILAAVPIASSDINTWNAILPYAQATWLVPVMYLVYLITRETFYFAAKPFARRGGNDAMTDGKDEPTVPRAAWNRIAALLPGPLAQAAMARPLSFPGRVRKTGPDGALMIIAVFIMIASAVHDVLIDRQVITGARLTTYGTLFFMLGVAGILSNRILKLYRQVGVLNRSLNEAAAVSARRAEYLTGIINGVDIASGDLVSVSNELTEIERTFSSLSDEQAASSSGMKAVFKDLTDSIAAISESAENQAGEGKKTTDMIEIFNRTQGSATGTIHGVLREISGVAESKGETERNLVEMTATMRVINEGGAAIKNFVELINDISDRINLLSLNASIEAARAGDHGRGFAVVADEIGKLATATSDNSQEISAQITKILSDINEGMRRADVTRESIESIFAVLDAIIGRMDQVENLIASQADAFQDVILQAERINSLSGGIAAATVDQMQSMESSALAVERLSEIAEEIAVLGKRILAFTETISGKSRELQKLIEETA